MKKFLSLDGLREFLSYLKNIFSPIVHSHSLSEISDLIIDNEVGNTSNLVKNSAINSAINTVKNELNKNIEDAITYTDTEIANLVNSAPDTLDTLGELAEAFKENEEVVQVLNDAIVTKADADCVLYKTPQELTSDEVNQVHKNLKLENLASEDQVEALYKSLTSNRALRFYCIEDVVIVLNGVYTTYPANSNVEVKFLETDEFEIIPTSDNSIMALNAFPGALGTYYSWLEGVKQFSNILFDMNQEAMYSKWSQGNQGAYQVQYAQYLNCIFWSDNPYISDVSKRTNYTLYYTSQLPLCYSTIPDNTFKAFYLAFSVNSDPNWGNKAYRDSFAKATWATQVFSYYGARTIGIFGHDNTNFNIVLPKDCRGLMYAATAIENAGTFDAVNTTNFGASSGSWRDAFGKCSSLKNLYIKNLKVNLNISWSPINYDSIYFIISEATNTNKITITVSPYTYNLLDSSDFELAASKNITITLLSTNYIEDKRLSNIDNKADKTYVDEKVSNLVGAAPEALDTLGELAAAIQENDEVVQILNDAIATKADIVYVDELIENIPTEPDIVIVDCPDGSIISHNFEQIMTAIRNNKMVYASIYGSTIASLKYVADDSSYIEFNAIRCEVTGDQSATYINRLIINSNNTFTLENVELPTLTSVENKKDKDLIVTYHPDSNFRATNSSGEILNAINNGQTVKFKKGAELLNILEADSSYVTFYMFYVNMEGKLQQKIVVVSGNDIIIEQDDVYEFVTKVKFDEEINKLNAKIIALEESLSIITSEEARSLFS